MATKPKPVQRVWQSLGEALAEAELPTKNECRSSRNASQGFTSSASFDAAVELARTGWNDRRNAMSLIVEKVATTLRENGAVRPVNRWDVCGSEVDVAGYLAGEPEHMRDAILIPSLGRTVRVAVQTSCSGAVSTDTIARRGAVVLALVDALRLCNVGVEVWAVNGVSGWEGAVRVCEPSASLDIDSVAFAIAHPSMQRRIFFALQERETDYRRFGFFTGGGYGGDQNSFGVYRGECSTEFRDAMGFDVYVGSGGRSDASGIVGDIDGDPVAWVQNTLAGLGVTTS